VKIFGTPSKKKTTPSTEPTEVTFHIGGRHPVTLPRKKYGEEKDKYGHIIEHWGPDFTGHVCDKCQGSADERGMPCGGFEIVEFPAHGMVYTGAAACPHCVFGAFRFEMQKIPWPDGVRLIRQEQERKRLAMGTDPEYTAPAETVAAAKSQVGELIGTVADDLKADAF